MTRRDLYLAFVAGVLVGALGMLAFTNGRDATPALARQRTEGPSLIAQVASEPALLEPGPAILPPPTETVVPSPGPPVQPGSTPPANSPFVEEISPPTARRPAYAPPGSASDEPPIADEAPAPAPLPTQRYQISSFAGQAGHGAYVIDTRTGKVWEIVGRQAPESIGKAE
jgi:hypothetical protein